MKGCRTIWCAAPFLWLIYQCTDTLYNSSISSVFLLYNTFIFTNHIFYLRINHALSTYICTIHPFYFPNFNYYNVLAPYITVRLRMVHILSVKFDWSSLKLQFFLLNLRRNLNQMVTIRIVLFLQPKEQWILRQKLNEKGWCAIFSAPVPCFI